MVNPSMLPGIREFDRESPRGAPEISDIYRQSIERLVLMQRNGVTHFYGGPLHLDDEKDVWLSPVEVDDGEQYSYFQLLYVNTRPEEVLSNPDVAVSYLEIDEASFKLTAVDSLGYEQLTSQFSGDRKQVLIRHCKTGMAYYPRPVTPNEDPDLVYKHLEQLVDAIGIREPEVSVSLSKLSEKDRVPVTTDLLETVHARKYPFGGGEIHSYGLILDGDPWQYYEIFTPHEIERISGEDLLVRVDSGCDIGQIYDDKGCDCRDQLHTALLEMQEVGNGLVIHIPSQDGRGFGAATKMETEGLKRGIEVVFNKGNIEPVDTVVAARMVLGEDFDIRTYEGAGRVLASLGIKSILLKNDNRLKAEGLAAGGIRVTRKRTNTTGTDSSRQHIEAKHKHVTYFGEDEN
ncbi:MAG: ribA [Candidatus Saccharibacteria bacterium]|nr:ribA [Candidatus Saccharibacteria bacterium]